jgi:hypothetical protein
MALTDPGKDRQIIDSGVGPYPPVVTLAGTVTRGDVIGYSSGWKRALATVGTAIQARLVALADGVSGDVIPVSPRAVVGGYSGGTPGNPVYVAEGTSNGLTIDVVPSTQGDATTVIGITLSATEVLFFLNSRADSVAA